MNSKKKKWKKNTKKKIYKSNKNKKKTSFNLYLMKGLISVDTD